MWVDRKRRFLDQTRFRKTRIRWGFMVIAIGELLHAADCVVAHADFN